MSQPISSTKVMRLHFSYHSYFKIPHDHMSLDQLQYACDRMSLIIYNTIFL